MNAINKPKSGDKLYRVRFHFHDSRTGDRVWAKDEQSALRKAKRHFGSADVSSVAETGQVAYRRQNLGHIAA